jgi:hypothetical protein
VVYTESVRWLAVIALVGCTGHGSAGDVCSDTEHQWSFAVPLRSQSIRLASGDTVVAGTFGALELGDGLVHNSVGPNDLYLATFDPAGVIKNLRRFVADQELLAIAADDGGGLAIAGTFTGELDFGGGPLMSTGERSMYVARFAPDGRLAFAQTFGDAAPTAIAISAVTSDIAIVGAHTAPIDFGGGALPGPAQFLLVLGPSGDRQFDRNLADGQNVDVGYAGSEIALAGSFVGSFDLGGEQLISAGGSDIYVARLGADGSHLASRSFGGPGEDGVQGFDGDRVSLAVIANGLVIAGGFTGTIDFGDGPHLAVDGLQDVFVVSLDASFDLRWSRAFGNPSFQAIGAIDADADDSIAFTGISDSGTIEGQPLACGGEPDDNGTRTSHLFAGTIERNGVLTWTRCFPATDFAAGTVVSYEGGSLALGGILGGELDVAGVALAQPDSLGGFTATVRPLCE